MVKLIVCEKGNAASETSDETKSKQRSDIAIYISLNVSK